jgi:predicted dehydrogenase
LPLKARTDVEIVGLVDLNPNAARARAEEHGLASVAIGSDLAEVLDQTQPDIVFDCTIPEAHCPVALTALSRDCHVFGEKPLADTMAKAKKMVEAAKRARKVCAVMQNRRFTPEIRRLRAFVESGALGRVTTVHSRFLMGAHFGGFRAEMQHVLLLDMAIHTFDAARFILRAESRSALCHEWNPPGSWYRHGASALAAFEMSDGLVYTYTGSWCPEGLNTTWESEWHVIGTEGSVFWNGGSVFRAEKVLDRTEFLSKLEEIEVPPVAHGATLTGHAGAIDDFLTALAEGRNPETIYSDNIKSLAMVHGAIQSAERGARVATGS